MNDITTENNQSLTIGEKPVGDSKESLQGDESADMQSSTEGDITLEGETAEGEDGEMVIASLEDLGITPETLADYDISGTMIGEADTSFNVKDGRYIIQIVPAPLETATGEIVEDANGNPSMKRLHSGALKIKVLASVDDKKLMDRGFTQRFYFVSKKGKEISYNSSMVLQLAMKILAVYLADKGVTAHVVPQVIKQNNISDFSLLYKNLPTSEENPTFLEVDLKVEDPDGEYPKNIINVRGDITNGETMLDTIRELNATS